MNFGEIRVFRFKRAQDGAEAISTNLGIDASAQFVVVDEKMVIILDAFVSIVHILTAKPSYSSLSARYRLLAVPVQRQNPVGLG